MNRLLIAAVVVIVLAVGVMLAIPNRTVTTTQVDRPTPMTKIDSDEITKVVLTHHVGKGDDRHKQRVVLLRREGEGSGNENENEEEGSEGESKNEHTWQLNEPVDAEANASAVKALVNRIGDLDITDIASENPESHENLEVTDEEGIHVEVYAGDNRLASFIIGRYASGHTMLRLPEQDVVYRARGSLRYVFGKDVADWRNKEIFNVDREEISEVTFQNAEGNFSFALDKSGDNPEWTITNVDALEPIEPEDDEGEGSDDEGETKAPAKAPAKRPAKRGRVNTIDEFDGGKVKSIVTSLARLRCSDFLDDTAGVETGLDNEEASRVSFKVGSGEKAKTYSVVLGGDRDKRNVYLKRTDRGQIYVVSSHLANRLRPSVASFVKSKQPPAKAGAADPGPGMAGMPPGLEGSKLSPELMKQLQEQMMRQKMMKALAEQAANEEK